MRPPIDTKTVEPICSLCGSKIKRVYSGERLDVPLEQDCINGSCNWFSNGYGSDFDGETWLLCFCNACLQKMKPLKIWDYLYQKEVEDT